MKYFSIFFLLLSVCFSQISGNHSDISFDIGQIEPPPTSDRDFHEMVHECGVALVRLRKPISHYVERYKDPAWGAVKLLSLMEKQRNRGQDAAGIAVVKLNMPANHEPLLCFRSAARDSLGNVARYVTNDLKKLNNAHSLSAVELKKQSSFIGEIYLGHLRYATYAGNQIEHCQPFLRSHSNPSYHLALAGNYNLTNMFELRQQLKDWGKTDTNEADAQAISEIIAHHLDEESKGQDEIDLVSVLIKAASKWDGGYVFCGVFGNGDLFICRDPAGIRPGYYFVNEEVVGVASEKVALVETFDLQPEEVLPIKPGHVIVIKSNGDMEESAFIPTLPERQCVFERIYFSKANDPQIHNERKALGQKLAPKVFEALGDDISHTVFTYVPNSSLQAFQGLVEEIGIIAHQQTLQHYKKEIEKGLLKPEDILQLPFYQPRTEIIITKKQKLRTFISSDQIRKDLVEKIYEVTKEIVTEEDTLVVVEDSIVRGTTLRQSLIQQLINLNPKKIIIVSSAPPILYPDCYGIDISQIGRFIGFQAVISLLEEKQQSHLLDEVYASCLKQKNKPFNEMQNEVKKLYDCCSFEEISDKIGQLLLPSDSDWQGSIQMIYQPLEGVHSAMPKFKGDWYFSGHYPTPGGLAMLNTSYLKWYNQDDSRSY